MATPILGGSLDVLAANGVTCYHPISSQCAWAAAVGGNRNTIGMTVTIKNFCVLLTVAPGVGKTRTFTFRQNGTDKTLAVAITGAATTGSDLTHTVSLAPYDLVDIKEAVSGNPASAVASWTFELDTDDQQLMGGAQDHRAENPCYVSLWQGGIGNRTTDPLNNKGIVQATGTLKNLYVKLAAAPPAGQSVAVVLRKNGGDTLCTCTIAAGATTGSDVTNQVAVSPGDYIDLKFTVSAGYYDSQNMWAALTFAPSTAGEMIFAMTPGISPHRSLTRYKGVLIGFYTNGWTATVASAWQRVTAGTFKQWAITLTVAPGAGKSYRFRLFVNGVASGLDITISGTATTGSDLTHEAAVNDGDYVYVRCDPTGNPNTTRDYWGIVFGLPTTAAACWGLHQGAKYEMVS